MSFQVSKIKTALAKGGARPSLFKIKIPKIETSTLGGTAPQMQYVCRAAQLPSAQVGVITTNYRGRPVKFSGIRVYDTWTTTILNDNGLKRKAIFDWMQEMAGDLDGVRGTNKGAYNSTTTGLGAVTQLNKDGTDGISYVFTNLFPIAIPDIPLDWSTESLQEFSVTWRFDHYDVGTLGAATAPTLSSSSIIPAAS